MKSMANNGMTNFEVEDHRRFGPSLISFSSIAKTYSKEVRIKQHDTLLSDLFSLIDFKKSGMMPK